MSKWIKKDDSVVVIAGNHKGSQGRVVERVGDRVIVQGVNIRKKHAKRRTQSAASQIIEMEMPIHISNVSLCSSDGKPVKARVRTLPSGGKELFYLEGNKEIVHRPIKNVKKSR